MRSSPSSNLENFILMWLSPHPRIFTILSSTFHSVHFNLLFLKACGTPYDQCTSFTHYPNMNQHKPKFDIQPTITHLYQLDHALNKGVLTQVLIIQRCWCGHLSWTLLTLLKLALILISLFV